MTKKLKKILAGVFLLVLATTSIAYAAQYYWRCSMCDQVVIRESRPSGGRCPNASYSYSGHHWIQDGKASD